jgi:hypothetical protein
MTPSPVVVAGAAVGPFAHVRPGAELRRPLGSTGGRQPQRERRALAGAA